MPFPLLIGLIGGGIGYFMSCENDNHKVVKKRTNVELLDSDYELIKKL